METRISRNRERNRGQDRVATSATATWFALVVVAASACSRATTAPAPEPAPERKPEPVETDPLERSLRDPARFDCNDDDDCVNSCGLGAVSADWYRTAESLGYVDCEDGCANSLSAPPRCEQGGCVAYMRDPHDGSVISRSGECTRREPR